MSIPFRKLPACLLCIGSLVACTPSLDASPSHHQKTGHLIRPGQSIGIVKLGASATTLDSLKQCPSGDDDAAMGHYITRYRASKNDKCGSLLVYTVRDGDGNHQHIEQAMTSSSTMVSTKGVRVGDSLARVKRAYPRSALVDAAGGQGSLYDDRKDGIAFQFRGDKATAIIVHPAGHGVEDEYMHIYQ